MSSRRHDLAIGVLARAPVPGACKTRLMPLLGAAGAARLQRQLITQALALTCTATPGAVTLFTAGRTADSPWSAWRQRFAVELHPQRAGDLGGRMRAALAHLLNRADRALLIGTDCPVLGTGDLDAAFGALRDARMVFQPAEDGGYVLVGARELHAAAFAQIPWGTAQVMRRTRAVLTAAGWRRGRDWRELPTSWDVDRPADLCRAVSARLLPMAVLDEVAVPVPRPPVQHR